jgi:hypothetical protein
MEGSFAELTSTGAPPLTQPSPPSTGEREQSRAPREMDTYWDIQAICHFSARFTTLPLSA